VGSHCLRRRTELESDAEWISDHLFFVDLCEPSMNLVWVTLACFSFARARPHSSHKQDDGYDREDRDHHDYAE